MTILLVDDRLENLIALQAMLEKDGRTFVTAGSGNEALKMALMTADIGLIMLDVQMPDMDGFEVARLLKSNTKTKDISIIFVTAINKEKQFILKGFEEGAVDYLSKPLDINVTRAKVEVFEQLYVSRQQLKSSLKKEEEIKKQLERFVYTVSHDLKSPLSGMVLMIGNMLYDMDDMEKEELKSQMQTVERASLHLSNMVDSILEYSRKSYGEQAIEEVDVNALVNDTFHLLFPPEHIELRITNPLPVFRTRKLKLQQVFQNLISNAIKYNDKKKGVIEVACKDADKYYLFTVKDNGQGMDEEAKHSIFSLFKTGGQVSQRDSSSGIGLNVLKVIIEEQGGKLWVESEPGSGSAFFFEWTK